MFQIGGRSKFANFGAKQRDCEWGVVSENTLLIIYNTRVIYTRFVVSTHLKENKIEILTTSGMY